VSLPRGILALGTENVAKVEVAEADRRWMLCG